MAYVTSKIGVDVTARDAKDTVTSSARPQGPLGDVVKGTDNGEWVYVRASGAIPQFSAVSIDENFAAAALTRTAALEGHTIGFAQASGITQNDCFWAQRNGVASVRVTGSVLADARLFIRTGSTAGVLDDLSAASSTRINGIVITATNTTGTGTRTAILNYPHADYAAV